MRRSRRLVAGSRKGHSLLLRGGFSGMVRYPKMRWLCLGGCNLSGPSLEVLVRLFDELQFLDLSNWTLGPPDVMNHLVPPKCFPKLQHLILPTMEEAIMAKFKANHPSCKVMPVGSHNYKGIKKRSSLHDPVNLSAFPNFRPRVASEQRDGVA